MKTNKSNIKKIKSQNGDGKFLRVELFREGKKCLCDLNKAKQYFENVVKGF